MRNGGLRTRSCTRALSWSPSKNVQLPCVLEAGHGIPEQTTGSLVDKRVCDLEEVLFFRNDRILSEGKFLRKAVGGKEQKIKKKTRAHNDGEAPNDLSVSFVVCDKMLGD